MKPFTFVFAIAPLVLVASDPSATIDHITRNVSNGSVTIEYTLTGADAVVTFGGDVSPSAGNWSALPESSFRRVSGDVNALVSPGSSKVVVWKPEPSDMYDAANGFRARLVLWSPASPPDFMSAEIGGSREIRYYASTNSLPYPITDPYWKVARILFRKIPAKNVVWNMASISPRRFVRLLDDYYLGVFPYTKSQAQNVARFSADRLDVMAPGADLGFSPSFGASYASLRGIAPDDETASYEIASDSGLAAIRAKVALDVDLPTEAEWEYACRAGCVSALYTGATATDENIGNLAWFEGNGRKVNEVGLKLPNAWGLYDMLGNVAEWCLDYYAGSDNDYFTDGTVDAPVGPASAQVVGDGKAYRVARGGCYWEGSANMALGANYRWGHIYTHSSDPAFGVRLKAPIPGSSAAKIENGTSTWLSLDTTVNDGYWNCTAYENPGIIEVTSEIEGVDFRSGTCSASLEVLAEGTLDSMIWSEDSSDGTDLLSTKARGIAVGFR